MPQLAKVTRNSKPPARVAAIEVTVAVAAVIVVAAETAAAVAETEADAHVAHVAKTKRLPYWQLD